MPTLRYYDGTQYQPLPGMPGPTGPSGPAGPAGPGWTGLTEYWRSQSAVAATSGNTSAVNVLIQDTTIPNLAITARAGVWYRVTVAARPLCSTAGSTMDIVVLDGGTAAPSTSSPMVAAGSVYLAITGGPGASQLVVHQDVQFTAGVHILGVFLVQRAGTANACQLSAASGQTKDLCVFNPSFSGPSGVTGATGPTGPPGLSGTIVSARLTRAAAYTLPTSTTLLTWDTKSGAGGWDTQNAYNVSTGLFTCPVAGKYRVAVSIAANVPTTGTYLNVGVLKNGTLSGAGHWSPYSSVASQWVFASGVDTFDCAVGDTLATTAGASAAVSLNVGAGTYNTYMTIDLLSGSGPQGVTGPTGPTGPSAAGGQLYNLVYYQTIPAPQVVSNPFTITHNLNTTYLLTQAWDSVTQQAVLVQWQAVDNNHVAISVSANMPNAVNVVVMGVGASQAPINPGDVATKAYVDAKTATLPAPVTSGSTIQSFTDVLGDVWVAKSGVNGGNWRRARDVLHFEYYRAAAWTAPTAWTNFVMDTVVSDAYGMYVGGFFTPPFQGLYQMTFQLTVNPTATAGIHFDVSLYDNGTGNYLRTNTGLGNATTWGIPAVAAWQGIITTQSSITARNLCSAALGGQVSNYSNGLTAAYLGTG